MKVQILKDFSIWKDLNKGRSFSLYDYLFHKTNEKKIKFDEYFAFQELFWPTFIVFEDYVFLKENFSEKKLENLQKDEKQIEFWMNLLTVDSFFSNEDEDEINAEFLAKKLVEIWEVKLKKDFPHKDFIVKYLCDSECGDYGLTFYQRKHQNIIDKQT